jgi:hypothetical protein
MRDTAAPKNHRGHKRNRFADVPSLAAFREILVNGTADYFADRRASVPR